MIMYISKFKFLTLLIVLLTIGTFSVSEEISEKDIQILDGDLVLPDDQNKNAEDMQCITICEQWGEDCIINPSRNSGARKCGRVCKAFAETCF